LQDEAVGSITHEEYKELDDKLKAGPHKYTKRIRMYVDVDGVVMPFIYSQEDLDKLDGQDTINVLNTNKWYGSDDTDIISGRFVYNKFVAAKLSEWSHRDDVDFIWLTSWRINAPYALDEHLNIKSVGYLPWDKKMSDYNHAFKRVAIAEEQAEFPSKFIWLDDFANKRREDSRIPVFTEGYYDSRWVEDLDSEIDDFTGEHGGHFEELGLVIEKEIIDPEQYLSITTKDTVGLSEKDISAIDDWLLAN
jgi:hypothetical protein